ncbi:hypothetical protein OH77DRAFT_143052 [Trametes cingulata]|nr:hypothetical protein OH77DRAFT_143052 [Trametes cingulata]
MARYPRDTSLASSASRHLPAHDGQIQVSTTSANTRRLSRAVPANDRWQVQVREALYARLLHRVPEASELLIAQSGCKSGCTPAFAQLSSCTPVAPVHGRERNVVAEHAVATSLMRRGTQHIHIHCRIEAVGVVVVARGASESVRRTNEGLQEGRGRAKRAKTRHNSPP